MANRHTIKRRSTVNAVVTSFGKNTSRKRNQAKAVPVLSRQLRMIRHIGSTPNEVSPCRIVVALLDPLQHKSLPLLAKGPRVRSGGRRPCWYRSRGGQRLRRGRWGCRWRSCRRGSDRGRRQLCHSRRLQRGGVAPGLLLSLHGRPGGLQHGLSVSVNGIDGSLGRLDVRSGPYGGKGSRHRRRQHSAARRDLRAKLCLHLVDGDGKPYPHYRTARIGLNHPGDHDSNRLPEHVQQRPAAVAWVEGRVGLEASVPLGRDDPAAHRWLVPQGGAQRETDGDNLRAHTHLIGVSDGYGREGLSGVYFDVRKVESGMGLRDAATVLAAPSPSQR